jgi:hypothetical protein
MVTRHHNTDHPAAAIGGRTLDCWRCTPGSSDWQRDPTIEIGNTYAVASLREAGASD